MGAKKDDMPDHIDNFINNDADTQIATKEPAPSATARSRSWPWWRVCSSISTVPSQKAAWPIETTVLAIIFYSCILSCVNSFIAEMTPYTHPLEASSVTLIAIAAEVKHPRTYVKKAF